MGFSCTYEKQNTCRFSASACERELCKSYYGKCAFCTASCKETDGNCGKKEVLIYAVKKGFHPGIYTRKKDLRKEIEGYAGAEYKTFTDRSIAEQYMNGTLKENPQSGKKAAEIKPYAYVDGSYNKFTKTYGYGGYVFDTKKHVLQGSGTDPEMASMRNVAGEILGATAAIQFAVDHGYKTLKLYYDYSGIECWPTGKWNAGKQGTMEYRDFCRKCMKEHGLKIEFVKVKGHSGVSGNEEADRLAKIAVGLSA